MRSVVIVVLAGLLAGCAEGVFEAAPEDGAPPSVVAFSTPFAPPTRGLAPDPQSRPVLAPAAPLACRKGAFCEDFEEPQPGARWSSSALVDGTLDFSGRSASVGRHSLRVTTPGSGAAYLAHAGAGVGQRWVGALGFSLRVSAAPQKALGGPRLVITDAAGGATRIGFSVRPAGIVLDQSFDSCSRTSCASRSDLVAPPRGQEWRKLVVALETFDSTTPPYGRIEVTVDDGDLQILPLVVTPFGGSVGIDVGITMADPAPATVEIDDVTFFTR